MKQVLFVDTLHINLDIFICFVLTSWLIIKT